MIDKDTVYEELKSNLKNIRFNKLCNFQNDDGWAKPYQVRQLLKIIDKYNLLNEENHV